MKLVSAKCPNCGGDLNVDENSKVIKCEYCNKSIIVEQDKLEVQDKSKTDEDKKEIFYTDYTSYKTKKRKKIIYLIITSVILIVANLIAMKISWDYENSLGAIAFLFSGLLLVSAFKESHFKEHALILSNIFGLIFFFAAMWFSLFVYNALPGYVNKWENDNIKLIIDRKEATVEFKNSGVKESGKYSASTNTNYSKDGNTTITKITILEYEFLYSAKEDDEKMCYSKDGECIEYLKLME